MDKKITKEVQQKIESKIHEFEARSSLEFVTVLAAASHTYHFFKLSMALSLAFATMTIFVYLQITQTLALSLVSAVGLGTALYLLLSWGPLFRLTSPRAYLLNEVYEAAHLQFLSRELFKTRDRSGVLIYISELEHAVYVLADTGVAPHLRPEEWTGLGERLAKDLSRGGAANTFLVALEEVYNRLSPQFPPVANNPNELPNKVVSLDRNF